MSGAIFFDVKTEGVLPCPKCGSPAQGIIYDESGDDTTLLSVECSNEANCKYSMCLYIPREIKSTFEDYENDWNFFLKFLMSCWNRNVRRRSK